MGRRLHCRGRKASRSGGETENTRICLPDAGLLEAVGGLAPPLPPWSVRPLGGCMRKDLACVRVKRFLLFSSHRCSPKTHDDAPTIEEAARIFFSNFDMILPAYRCTEAPGKRATLAPADGAACGRPCLTSSSPPRATTDRCTARCTATGSTRPRGGC